MVRVPKSFVDKTLWPEYQELRAALDDYLNDATERIIREVVYRDAEEAPERILHDLSAIRHPRGPIVIPIEVSSPEAHKIPARRLMTIIRPRR